MEITNSKTTQDKSGRPPSLPLFPYRAVNHRSLIKAADSPGLLALVKPQGQECWIVRTGWLQRLAGKGQVVHL